ncbi:probable G-protein coupled receptor 171 [Gouania willdenowi]|uniref:G-protein coupled receptors family 1 profile domain-containing protein n=1 Tax=Gouania willdenowi TaxID=441366 RepID=A0A8C5G416_GOUWI|nr:probable G-protein coupled receptor 171 [Gouania willdenowi]XP_028321206.1 probable G-protein coupled receptor 171 [Gouania willdenowi]
MDVLTSANVSAVCVVNDHMTAFIVLYSLVFFIGLPAHLLSVLVFIISRRQQHSRGGSGTRLYLLNLLLADLLLLLMLPFKILKDSGSATWNLTMFHCRFSAVVFYISLYSSLMFLTLIISQRHLQASQSSFSRRLQEVGFSRLLSVVVWFLLIVINLPNMVLPLTTIQPRPFLSCSSLKSEMGHHFHTLAVLLNMALFLNASVCVLFCCILALRRLLGRGGNGNHGDARRAALSVKVTAAAYALSFVPYHAVRMPYTLAQVELISDCWTRRQLFLWKEATLLLSVLRLCFDPLLFFCLCSPFRRTISSTIRRTNTQPGQDRETSV